MHDRDALRRIKSFPQLVAYLRDELDWPIESDDFDDITFDWEPTELGIDLKNSAKIEQIKQLRPFSSNQPWGIFFVKFDKKKLPVVALRRLLGRLVIKKRATAKSSEHAAWAMNDLLFISAYGEGDDRRISLAHFTDTDHMGDLPSLRVLGFSEGDRDLKVDHVHREMETKLRWPHDTSQLDRWRKDWRSAFMLKHGEVIRTSRDLALKLAELARDIRGRVNEILEIESEGGPLRKLMAAFREALIHDLEEDDFADMYAQTIAYGLLSTRVSRTEGLVADDLLHMIPSTNPFLKELMETFLDVGGKRKRGAASLDFDELGINEVVELLREANMEAVLRDFDSRNPREDPVIHFYELFLKEYDAKKRMQRGVFYTPRPVVSFIVRSVDEILRTEFGLEDGLADTTTWGEMAQRHDELQLPDAVSPDDPFVQILDPATGTGTFLVEVINVIHRTMTEKWRNARCSSDEVVERWNEYVPRHLLPRVHGYELMMAPYAIAHMKIGLKLFETGYTFRSHERARVYLTNALERAHDFTGVFEQMAPALAHEATAVNQIKRQRQFTVVTGNPPYSGHSVNNHIDEIVDLVYDYKRGIPELQRAGQAKWLQDDYVKFIRYGERLLETSPAAILAFITNHSFLDNATFKGMRRHVIRTFSRLTFVDLHGNTKKKERSADGTPDENVFEIQQGVAIIFARRGAQKPVVEAYDLFGSREDKYTWLEKHVISTTPCDRVHLKGDSLLFRVYDHSLAEEYQRGIALPEIMGENGKPAPGIVTTHDSFAISWTRSEAISKVERLLDTTTEEEARQLFTLCSQSQWNYARAKSALKDGNWRKQLVPILYRPFDIRWTVYNPHVAVHRRDRVMHHMLKRDNLAIICTRQTKDQWGVFATREIAAHKTCGAYDINYLFPFRLLPPSDSLASAEPRVNFSTASLRMFDHAVGQGTSESRRQPEDTFPLQVFRYIYAVFHSPSYRTRYSEFLKTEFPRVPLPKCTAIFEALAALGGELLELHILESGVLSARRATYAGPPQPHLESVGYARNSVWLNKKRTCGFAGVSEEVWNFHVGGYQVCQKWLKDRKGRTLSADDIGHYEKIIVAISETIRLMKHVDELIDRHGGWPDAFVTEPMEVEQEETLPFR